MELNDDFLISNFKKMVIEKLYDAKSMVALNDECNADDEIYSSRNISLISSEKVSSLGPVFGEQNGYENILNHLIYTFDDKEYKKEDLKKLMTKLYTIICSEKLILDEAYATVKEEPKTSSEILNKIGYDFVSGRVEAYDYALFWLRTVNRAIEDEDMCYNDAMENIKKAEKEMLKKNSSLAAVAPHEIGYYLFCNYNN